MSTERDQGFAALQSGDVAGATVLLEQATRTNPNDYQAFLYLGAAYGQTGRHQDAVQALTQAVTLEPGNAQARFNLGVALERSGWKEQAQTAFEQALTLQPDYTKAQEALNRVRQALGVNPTAAPVPPAAPMAESYASPAAASPLEAGAGPTSYAPGLGQPTPYAQPGQPQPAPPPAMEQPGLATYGQPNPYAQPGAAPLGQQPPPYAPPGVAQNPYAQPGMPAAPSPYGQPGGYGQPPMGAPGYPASPYGAQAPYNPALQSTFYEDKFDIKAAFSHWLQMLRMPSAFLAEHAPRTGVKAPTAFLFFIFLVNMALQFLGSLTQPAQIGAAIVGILIILTIFFGLLFLILRLAAAFMHWIARMFGGSAENTDGAFRSVCYAYTPLPILGLIMTILSLVMAPAAVNVAPNSREAMQALPGLMALGGFSLLLMLIGVIWMVALTTIGLSHAERISVGAALGTVIITAIIGLVLYVAIIVGLGVAFIGASGGFR